MSARCLTQIVEMRKEQRRNEVNMNKTTKKIIGAFTVILVVAAAVLAVYFLLNRQAEKEAEEGALPTTEIGKLLAKDLELKYPETPTEVVKLYWRINRCLYNDDLNDKDFEALFKQLRLLYDEEFLADENNSYEKMMKKLKKEKEGYGDKKKTISVSVVQKNDTLKTVELDGKECVTVISSTLLTDKGDTTKTFEQFICRRDSNRKWKILGWQLTTEQEAKKVGVK